MSTRRTLLAAAPALLTWGCASRLAMGGADPFGLGVASGDPAPDGFVIWTRLAPDPLAENGLGGMTSPAPVLWEVAADETMRQVVARGRVEADAALAYSVHVEVAGLQANRPYWYRFTAVGARSPVGVARTTPAPGQAVDRLRFAVASCAHYEVGFFSAYGHMGAERPDFSLFLGDYIYEYSYGPNRPDLVRRHETAREIQDLAAYRRRYACYRTDADLQALHAAAPSLIVWDDHEVQNDYGALLSQYVSVTPERFAARRAAAYQAFYEHMPVRRPASSGWGELRVHKRVRLGTLAELSLLDTRQFRSPPVCLPPTSRQARVIDPNCQARLDPARSMLGLDQETWLYDGFRQASARWNLVGQSLLAASVRQRAPNGDFGHWSDGWDGYAASRDRMLEAIRQSRLANPVVLSGDIHSFWANEIKAAAADPVSATIAPEFVCTSVTADPPPAQPFVGVQAENPHVRYFDARRHGYTSVELSPARMEVRFQAVSDRRDPSASVSTLQRFAVEAGSPAIHLT